VHQCSANFANVQQTLSMNDQLGQITPNSNGYRRSAVSDNRECQMLIDIDLGLKTQQSLKNFSNVQQTLPNCTKILKKYTINQQIIIKDASG
jgi:hypothetical protein